jgi:hypothetical protein
MDDSARQWRIEKSGEAAIPIPERLRPSHFTARLTPAPTGTAGRIHPSLAASRSGLAEFDPFTNGMISRNVVTKI